MTENRNLPEKRERKDLQKQVMDRIDSMVVAKEIVVPMNYSPGNAVKSAFLIISELKDKNGKPALEVCTKESISEAILETVIMGLSPAKKQVYYIVRGNKLCRDDSYFGTIAMLKRLKGYDNIECNAQVIWEGDTVEYEIKKGKIVILSHEQDIQSIGKRVAGAYCTILTTKNGVESETTTIMSMDQILKSWKRGATKGGSSAHTDQPEEMAKRTVINRAVKMFINTSDDSDLDFAVGRMNSSDSDTQESYVDDGEIIDGEIVSKEEQKAEEGKQEEKPTRGRPPKQATLTNEPATDGCGF